MEPDIEELRAEARYRREKHRLYRARAYGLRATSEARMKELERAADGAEARLERAEAAKGEPKGS